MDKRFWISGIVAFIVLYMLSFVVHSLILGGDYMRVMEEQKLFRPPEEAMNYMPFMLVAHLLMGFAFAWIYRQGIAPNEPWLMQGVRFGVAAALFGTVPMYLIYYSLQPWPFSTVIKQIVLQTISTVIAGIVVAWLNRSPMPAQA
jgi:hypothetical protein